MPVPGERLGPYELISPLGAGGMGEVWRATDTRLNRTVAVKFVKAAYNERFKSEAKAISALNHPHICQLYDVGDNFLVMEFIDGAPARGPMPLRTMLRNAAQAARGLAAAHAAGIVHRDLKPDNILITRDGSAKVLDFGLARMDLQIGAEDVTRTVPGMLMGTIGYMAPEQVRGERADHRSDIFALGVVMYEWLTGERPFTGNTAPELMSAILRDDPRPVPEATSPNLKQILLRCLEKEPRRRFQSADDLAFALDNFSGTSSPGMASDAVTATITGSTPAPASGADSGYPANPLGRLLNAKLTGWLGRTPPLTGNRSSLVVLVALLLGYAGRTYLEPPALDTSALSLTPISTDRLAHGFPAWSSDGRSFVYARLPRQLLVRSLENPDPVELLPPNFEYSNLMPVWAPDGTRIYFTGSHEGTNQRSLFAVSAAGGAPSLLLKDVGRMMGQDGLAVSPDGQTLVVAMPAEGRQKRLMLSSPPGAPPQPWPGGGLALAAGGARVRLQFSKDGRELLVVEGSLDNPRGSRFMVLPWPPRAGVAPKLLFDGPLPENSSSADADWMPDGRHLLMSFPERTSEAGRLWVGDTVTGTILPVTDPSSRYQRVVVSRDGRALVSTLASEQDIVELSTDGGPMEEIVASHFAERYAQNVPGTTDFVYVTNRSGPLEIWLGNRLGRPHRPVVTPAMLPQEKFDDLSVPAVSPDGKRIAYNVSSRRIYVSPVNGGVPVPLGPAGPPQIAASWAPDGETIAYLSLEDGSATLRRAKVGSSESAVITKLGMMSVTPVWSPDGRWITIERRGQFGVISPDGKTFRPFERSLGLSAALCWSRDSSTLYAASFESGQTMLFAIDVATGRLRLIRNYGSRYRLNPRGPGPASLSLSADGKHLLASRSESSVEVLLLDGLRAPLTFLDRLWQPLRRRALVKESDRSRPEDPDGAGGPNLGGPGPGAPPGAERRPPPPPR